jgi:hypothetical protein
MQNVPLMYGGDKRYRADTSNRGKVDIKTANYTIKVHPTIYSNKGAAGTVLITLPTATEGAWFTLLKATNQTLGFQASGGAKINAEPRTRSIRTQHPRLASRPARSSRTALTGMCCLRSEPGGMITRRTR